MAPQTNTKSSMDDSTRKSTTRQALYRKYRSKSLDEVVGQNHITSTLKKAMASGSTSHAYLFTGPRGVGKTSIARILAHEVNQLPYSDESIHLDIIEIDAASNRRIDEIRDLRDKVHISPTSAKYKVYIIDEVHMLTREAFNALLKTLEEPPAHAIFILATTEAHKLPETIVSRTQRFEFKPIAIQDASGHLADIAKKEKIKVSSEALELIAEHGKGSFRDSISLLDQLSSFNQDITAKTVEEFLGLPSKKEIESLCKVIISGQADQVIEILDRLKNQGSSSSQISSELSKNLREEFLNNYSLSFIPLLLKELILVPTSANPDNSLEIVLLEATLNNTGSKSAESPNKEHKAMAEIKTPQQEVELASPIAKTKIENNDIKNLQPDSEFKLTETLWNEIIERAKDKAASIYTALKLANPKVEQGILILYFKFPLHQKKINQAKHRDLVSSIIEEISGSKIEVRAEVKDLPENIENNEPKKAAPQDQVNAISNIFGNAEVLES